MANDNDDDLDKEALTEQLGGGAHDQRVRDDAPTAATLPAAPSAPWEKGQVVGGAREGADFARLGGGFGDANTDSLKHTFGRLAQNFASTPEGLNQLVADAEFKRLFPNATVSKDWIDFGGQVDPHTGTKVGKIDVQHAWDPTTNTGKNWQWLTEEEAMGGGGGAPNVGERGASNVPALLASLDDSGVQEQVQKEIEALIEGGTSPIDQQALLEQLQG